MHITINVHKHHIGDGLHFITNNFKVFENGDIQYGETSENCILLALEIILIDYGLPSVNELWNQVYPDDFMAFEDLAYIMESSIDFLEHFDKHRSDSLQSIVDDVRSIECHKLASLIVKKFGEIGISLR